MAQFKAFDSKVEVNGETVLSVMDGMGLVKHDAIHIRGLPLSPLYASFTTSLLTVGKGNATVQGVVILA